MKSISIKCPDCPTVLTFSVEDDCEEYRMVHCTTPATWGNDSLAEADVKPEGEPDSEPEEPEAEPEELPLDFDDDDEE